MPSANLTNSIVSLRSLMVNRGLRWSLLTAFRGTLHSEDFLLCSCLLSLALCWEKERRVRINPGSFPHQPMDTSLGLSETFYRPEHTECKEVSRESGALYVRKPRKATASMSHWHELHTALLGVLQCQLFGSAWLDAS